MIATSGQISIPRRITKTTNIGYGEIMLEMADAFGAPEFFYTTVGKTEDAGGGCIRVYCCIERGGVLVTQLTVVMPAASLIAAAKVVEVAALDAFQSQIACVTNH